MWSLGKLYITFIIHFATLSSKATCSAFKLYMYVYPRGRTHYLKTLKKACLFGNIKNIVCKLMPKVESWHYSKVRFTAALQYVGSKNTKILFSRWTRKILDIGRGFERRFEMPQRGVRGRRWSSAVHICPSRHHYSSSEAECESLISRGNLPRPSHSSFICFPCLSIVYGHCNSDFSSCKQQLGKP